MSQKLNRRIFLKGLGGACVAAPFLGSIVERGANAASPAPPKRLIAMFTHNGCITTRYFPKLSHGPLSSADLQSTTLKPLAPYADKLLMPRGIRAMNEWTSTVTLGQGNDPHTQVVGSYFTCQPVTPNSDDPFSFATSTKFRAMPMGPSLDHVIAQQLSPAGAPLLMHVAGTKKESPPSAISYSARETPFLALNAQEAFNTLTGLSLPGTPISPDTYRAVRGQSVIDLVKDDLDTLARFDMSASDKQKLEAWKQLLHDTGGAVFTSPQCNQDVATALGGTAANVAASGMRIEGSDIVSGQVNGTTLDGADVYSAIAVLAAVCNTNPVIFLKYPQAFIFSGLGIRTDSESLSGRMESAGMQGPCAQDALANLLKIDEFYARKFARLVTLLDGVAEGDGKVLDNTAAVWFQEMSDGCATNLNNMPIIQAGSAGGYFKTGQIVNVDDGSTTLSNGNSEIFCGPDGPDTVDGLNKASGTDPSLANAPINKYYCNLMNALGVKAGADGFPLKGGSQEVTCFGMYDRTEDFVGGGTNPPKIHDPGGFGALKA